MYYRNTSLMHNSKEYIDNNVGQVMLLNLIFFIVVNQVEFMWPQSRGNQHIVS